MITNDKQYKITKNQISKFEDALEEITNNPTVMKDIHPQIVQAQKQALQFQLNQLLISIQEYEDLKAGKIIISKVRDLNDLPLALIKARIANGLTQSELAGKLGMQEQQIQRYEADKYESTNLKTVKKIADALSVRLEG